MEEIIEGGRKKNKRDKRNKRIREREDEFGTLTVQKM